MVDDPLADEPFSYRATKNGAVQLFHRGRLVKTIKGREADRFLARAEGAGAAALQQLLARATGAFKFGNEKAVRPRDLPRDD
jgi:hypothetical protein